MPRLTSFVRPEPSRETSVARPGWPRDARGGLPDSLPSTAALVTASVPGPVELDRARRRTGRRPARSLVRRDDGGGGTVPERAARGADQRAPALGGRAAGHAHHARPLYALLLQLHHQAELVAGASALQRATNQCGSTREVHARARVDGDDQRPGIG